MADEIWQTSCGMDCHGIACACVIARREQRCGTCRHWESDEDAPMVDGLEGHRYCLSWLDSDKIVGLESECGPRVSVATAPDFGCVLWQAKEG